jgi:hypothetical protein
LPVSLNGTVFAVVTVFSGSPVIYWSDSWTDATTGISFELFVRMNIFAYATIDKYIYVHIYSDKQWRFTCKYDKKTCVPFVGKPNDDAIKEDGAHTGGLPVLTLGYHNVPVTGKQVYLAVGGRFLTYIYIYIYIQLSAVDI